MEQVVAFKSSFWNKLFWMYAVLFWSLVGLAFIALLNANGDSGAGYLVVGLIAVLAMTWYLFPLSICLFGYGMFYAAKKGERIVSAIIRWSAVSIGVHLTIALIIIKFTEP